MFVDHSQLSYLVCVLATGSAFIYVPGSPVVLEQESAVDPKALQSR
jgi:hypothetical protein